MPVFTSIFVLLAFQLAGEMICLITHLPIPGPVIGMVLLALFYIARKRDPEEQVQKTSDVLLQWLGLLFVPAGVGVIANVQVLRGAWLPVAAALIVSSLFTLVVTAWVMNRLQRRLVR